MDRKHRPTMLQRTAMSATGLIALAIAYGGLVNPTGLLEGMQLTASGPAGLNEIRGQYGGFFLLTALFACFGAVGYIRPTSVLAYLIVLYGGVFLGRAIHLLSVGFDEFATYPPAMQAIHLVDLTGLLLSVAAIRQGERD